MTKKVTNSQINLFCSISKNRLDEVNKTLIPSIIKQKGVKNIVLTIINYKADKSITPELVMCDKNIELNILNPEKPLGFGEAHNYAFKEINPKDFFIILNPDLSLHNECIKHMVESFNEKIGLIEARQLPFTHPKDKPRTNIFETNWGSGSCLLINSRMFKEVRGFDTNYWMYLEDVDLSWRSWIHGYKVIQNPRAIAYHFTGVYFSYTPHTYALEDFWSIRNFLYISYVYWGRNGLTRARKLLNDVSHYNNEIKTEAIESFEALLNSTEITRIYVPSDLQDRIKIFGYNKFSEYPK